MIARCGAAAGSLCVVLNRWPRVVEPQGNHFSGVFVVGLKLPVIHVLAEAAQLLGSHAVYESGQLQIVHGLYGAVEIVDHRLLGVEVERLLARLELNKKKERR